MYPIKIANVNGRNLTIGPVRLTFAHLFEPWASAEADPATAKYQTACLIPKTESAAIAAINQAVDAAVREGISKIPKWGNKRPSKFDTPLRDGDEKEGAGPEYAGMLTFNAKSTKRPSVVIGRNFVPTNDPDQVYSGCWALLNVSFYGYSKNGNNGVGVALNSVCKIYDDEPLGGGTVLPQQAFGGVDFSVFGDAAAPATGAAPASAEAADDTDW